jgi:Beta-lactamase enzyme family
MPDPNPHDAPGAARPRGGVARLLGRGRTVFAAVAVALVVAAISVIVHRGLADGSPVGGLTFGTRAATPTTSPPSINVLIPITPKTSAAPVSAVQLKARARVAALIAAAPAGGVSVAVRDVTTGRQYSAGAGRGMVEASVAKVQILETMLLQSGGPLTGAQDASAQDMIEHSSNDAADDCFADLGGRDGFVAALPELGLSPEHTVPGPGYLWGLSTTSAAEQVTLLANLVDPSSPLRPAARQYMLEMMRQVEADQRWGVPAVADPGTMAANKNGWLAIDGDDDLWAVNSDGIVTVHGHELLVSVLTQHNPDFATGTRRMSALVPALVASVLG